MEKQKLYGSTQNGNDNEMQTLIMNTATTGNDLEEDRNQNAFGQAKSLSLSSSVTTTATATVPLLLALIFLCLSYMIVLGHNILNELQDQNIKFQPYFVSLSSTTTSGRSSHASGYSDNGGGSFLTSTTNSLLPFRPSPMMMNIEGDGDKKKTNDALQVLIVYIPNDEGQQIMASKVAEGVEAFVVAGAGGNNNNNNNKNNVNVILEPVTSASFQQVLEADAIILGSSVENGNVHPMLQSWINENWDIRSADTILKYKVGAAFVTAGGMSAGEEGTLASIIRAMLMFRMIIVGGDDWRSAFGASAITAEAPFTKYHPSSNSNSQSDQLYTEYFTEDCYESNQEIIHPMFQSKAYGLGVRVATAAMQLKASSYP